MRPSRFNGRSLHSAGRPIACRHARTGVCSYDEVYIRWILGIQNGGIPKSRLVGIRRGLRGEPPEKPHQGRAGGKGTHLSRKPGD